MPPRLPDEKQRPVAHFVVYPTDVGAENSDRDQLHAAEEHDDDDQSREASWRLDAEQPGRGKVESVEDTESDGRKSDGPEDPDGQMRETENPIGSQPDQIAPAVLCGPRIPGGTLVFKGLLPKSDPRPQPAETGSAPACAASLRALGDA